MHAPGEVGVRQGGGARRGFSYALDTEMRGYDRAFAASSKIQARINLRLALMPDPSSGYPPRVLHHLSETPREDNHYFCAGLPSIAFAFGLKTPDAWYVFAMQSDLTSRGPSCVREHFRGWRHVLFANIVRLAAGHAERLLLCQAADVERTRVCPSESEAGRSPLWADVYDRTARDWGMTLAPVATPVNVQLLRNRAPIYADHFHELRLDGRAPGIEPR